MRAKPRAQQGPKTFHGIDVDLTEAILVLITSIFGLGMMDGFMGIAPGFQLAINGVFIGKNDRTGLDGLTHQGLNGLLLDVGEYLNNDFPAALDHAEEGWFFFRQGEAPWRSFQVSASSQTSLLGRRFGMTLVPMYGQKTSSKPGPSQNYRGVICG